jgi:ABC-type amino acid transport/signal transduction systems, periplasmic component/domain
MKHLKPLLMLVILCVSLVIAPLNAFAAATSSSSSASSDANQSAATDDSVQRIKQKGTLVVGTSADYPPYEFTTKKNGKTEYVGFEMDVAKQFAKDLGVKLVIKNMDFDSLLVALESHKVEPSLPE